MLEVSIAAVVIAGVGWDAFRRYLARAKDEAASMTLIKAVDGRIDMHAQRVDVQTERVDVLRDKLNKVATDLGALSITETPAVRGSRRR